MRTAPLLAVLFGSVEGFLLFARHLAHQRTDPIVQPNIVSGHVHDVVGASAFSQTFDPDKWAASNCSTMEIQDNLSNYWMPSVHAQLDNGSFVAVPVQEVRVYYLNNHPDGTKVTAFPRGFRMVAGNPAATSIATAQPGYTPLDYGFRCQNGNGNIDGQEYFQYSFPNTTCKDFLRVSINFADCWDGVNLDSTTHTSHVAYRFNNGSCPSTHPVPMMEIDLEIGYKAVNYRPEQIIFSTGDRAGYGVHGDYLSFWDVDLLQKALDDPTCQHREGVDVCQTFAGLQDTATMNSCRLETAIPQEGTGIDAPQANLPGCNRPYDSRKNETKPTCSPAPSVPAIGPPSEFLNFNPQFDPNHQPPVDIPIYLGFNPAPTTSTTAAAPSSTSSSTSISTSSSSSKPTSTSTSLTKVATTLSTATSSRKTTTTTTTTTTTAVSTPSATSLGCYTDSQSSRALPLFAPYNGTLTPAKCAAACGALGYALSGVEYGAECWCGASVQGGNAPAPSGDCNMACGSSSSSSSKTGETCGGSGRIAITRQPTTAAAAVPAPWRAAGCYTDSTTARALPVPLALGAPTTVAACLAACGARGYAVAGVEYAGECYCGSGGVQNGAALTNDAECNMPCAGDARMMCGGGNRINIYTKG